MGTLLNRGLFLLILASGLSVACQANLDPAASSNPLPVVRRVVMAVPPPRQEHLVPRNGDQTSAFQVRPVYEYLIGIDPESGKFTPHLATAWNLEPDGLSFRFKLRQGVPFHRGYGEFSSKDVVFSHEQFVREDSAHSNSASFRLEVAGVTPINDYEVVYRLARPFSAFLNVLSEQQGNIGDQVSKAHHEAVGEPTNFEQQLVGTGPYQSLERSQGSYVRFERVPYQHWRVAPDFPEFEFRWVNENSTRLAALLAHEVHLSSVPEEQLGVARASGMQVIEGRVPGQRTYIRYFGPNFQDATKNWAFPDSPLLDVRVRRAFSKAIDRDALNKAFFGGKAVLMHNAHQIPSREGWNPDWVTRFPEEYGYNPSAARALLAEAGYGPAKPLTTNLFLTKETRGLPASLDLTEAIGSYLRAVGVEVNLIPIEDAVKTAGTTPPFKWDNHMDLDITAADLFASIQVKNSGLRPRLAGFATPEMDAVYTRFLREMDDRKRDDLARQWGDLHYNSHASLPLFWISATITVDPAVVADYVWPGSFTGTWSHVEYIRAAAPPR